MLTPDQITALRDMSGQIVDPIVEFLIEDIARRVSEAGQLTGTAAYQIWQAQKLGLSQRQLKKELRKRLKVSHRQLRQLLTQAAEAGYDFDIKRFPQVQAAPFAENTTLQQLLDATVKLAQDDLSNVTQTMGFITPDGKCEELTKAYQKTCDFAFQKAVSGAQDYTSAIRDATRHLAEKGIRTIDYESGVHTSLEAAVRRNIMGGLGLMNEQITQQNHDDLGCDGWEISAHGGCAPDHEPIQGKQYSDAAFTRLNNSLVRRIGTLNCGHSAMPIILGVNEPQYTAEELEKFRQQNEAGIDFEGKHYTLYEATQRQRSLERSIRKTKRKILIDEATGDTEKLQWDQIRLVRTREEYHRFSKAAGLPEQFERMEKAGFSFRQGKAAEKAAQNVLNRPQLRDSARFRDAVSIIPPFKGDAITHRSLYNNLAKTEIGRETIEYITAGKCFVEISYADDAPEGERGYTTGFSIVIHAKNTRTIKETAKTIVHEVTHSKYGIGGSQYAEAVCFAREHLHEHGSLTNQDLRNIIKIVKRLYPEYEWRKGGRNKWRK